jgi:hypothetical protein
MTSSGLKVRHRSMYLIKSSNVKPNIAPDINFMVLLLRQCLKHI